MKSVALSLSSPLALAPAFVAALALSFFFAFTTPARAASLTPEQVNAVVNLLQSFGADPAVISNVQISLEGGTPTVASTSPSNTSGPSTSSSNCSISDNLTLGSSGPEVSCLQALLAQDSSIYPEGIISGFFGQLTRNAVKRFQKLHGIASSGDEATTGWGRVGKLTLSQLLSGATTTDISSLRLPGRRDGEHGHDGDEGMSTSSAMAPTIASITVGDATSTGAVGDTAVIHGSGFTQSDNTVTFGIGAITDLASPDGTTLTFAVPSSLRPLCAASAVCSTLVQNVASGTYNVSVSNKNGASNVVQFTVTEPTVSILHTVQLAAAVIMAPFEMTTNSLANVFYALGLSVQ